MNKYSDNEIKEEVLRIWNDGSSWSVPDVEIEENTPEQVRIRLSKQYEAPGLSLKHLQALCIFFGTDEINDGEDFAYSGCETCDYGSSYGFTLYVRPNGWDLAPRTGATIFTSNRPVAAPSDDLRDEEEI